MPKLLYLATEDWFFLSHFLPMARAARECGFDVVVATRTGAATAKLVAEGLEVVPLTTRRGNLGIVRGVRDFVQILKIVRAQRADVVHCISLQCIVVGGIAAKLTGVRALVLAPTGLGHLWLERGMVAGIFRALVRTIVGFWLRGPRTFYLFENRDDPSEFGLDPDGSGVVIVGGSGVDPMAIPRMPAPPGPALKVAVVSRMIEPKGIAESVEAAKRARSAGAPIELHLFGDPDPANPRSIPATTLRAWSNAPAVVWHGEVDDVARIWREHHVAMLLSYREGLPRALVEAAAAGRPIVTTDVPGCREVVRDGEEGFLVPLGDIDAAAGALVKLAADSQLRDRMGAAAYGRFRERFTVDSVRQTVRNLYQSLRKMSDADR